MRKTFIVSLHRSGTQSVNRFLRDSGFNAIHWPVFFEGVNYQSLVEGVETSPGAITDALAPILEAFEAVSDVPLPAI